MGCLIIKNQNYISISFAVPNTVNHGLSSSVFSDVAIFLTFNTL